MAMSPFDPFALARWDPFGNMTSLRDAMNRLMESSVVTPAAAFGGNGMSVPLDLSETDDQYRIQASLPGMRPEDVHVTVHDNLITIEGERSEDRERKDGERSLFTEHHYGSFSRSFSLPMAVDADRAQAEFKDGMLCLTLPKSEVARPRRIHVNGGGSTRAIEGQKVGTGSRVGSARSTTSRSSRAGAMAASGGGSRAGTRASGSGSRAGTMASSSGSRPGAMASGSGSRAGTTTSDGSRSGATASGGGTRAGSMTSGGSRSGASGSGTRTSGVAGGGGGRGMTAAGGQGPAKSRGRAGVTGAASASGAASTSTSPGTVASRRRSAASASGARARSSGSASGSSASRARRSASSRGSMGTNGVAEMGSSGGEVHREPVALPEEGRRRQRSKP
jgi:HSP20 family protein